MTDREIKMLIRQVIREEIAHLLMGSIVENKDQLRSTFQRFKSESGIPNARNIQPFGLSSRAPKGTDCVVSPVNGDKTHMNVLGHFDKNKPTVDDGETSLYNEFGQEIHLGEDTIKIGSKAAGENAVLGQVFKQFASDLLGILQIETHITGVPGYSTSPPEQTADYAALQASPINDEAVLSDYIFVDKEPS
jgi:hypothetical protein